ncbi:MAG: polysaccharide pyruvyl transferase family protein [Butyrivibrio sp.]|nr:polysaccharide pyruvyl transferase family protein [Butyrivibrio sp.]
MKRRIGLYGCMVNNDNMGCCALTYSLINTIEKWSKENKEDVVYVIFERNPDAEKVAELAKALGIDKERVVSELSARFIRLNEWKVNKKCKKKIAECDIVIDLTQGDSFTDIYGMSRFISYSLDKLTVEKLGVPLILGPQTYGPFRHSFAKSIAKKAINNACFVMSRDVLSKSYLDDLKVKKEVVVGTDLAIGLPYNKCDKKKNSVGINISGLLWPDKIEVGTDRKFTLKCDYKEFMVNTTKLFLKKGYDVFFISHVGADYPACSEMKKLFPETTLVDQFVTPVEAKTFISGLNLFIGARMHATIAALSSGVPVIPVAYSRKFKGLFENCQYDIGIDLTELDDAECMEKMVFYSDHVNDIQEKVLKSREVAIKKHEEMSKCLCGKIFMEGISNNE